MDTLTAVVGLYALAQESRLEIFRLLVRQGPAGLCVGDIAAQLAIAPATLSFHLKELLRAGLLTANRQSRHIYYAADFPAMNELLAYLTENCCGGAACGGPARPQAKRKKSGDKI
jgi:ArsR family transcriptional regulator, arsenate/arsenite/antimonite-responsive transcriptional repressor